MRCMYSNFHYLKFQSHETFDPWCYSSVFLNDLFTIPIICTNHRVVTMDRVTTELLYTDCVTI
jgi:hypothetical protein